MQNYHYKSLVTNFWVPYMISALKILFLVEPFTQRTLKGSFMQVRRDMMLRVIRTLMSFYIIFLPFPFYMLF